MSPAAGRSWGEPWRKLAGGCKGQRRLQSPRAVSGLGEGQTDRARDKQLCNGAHGGARQKGWRISGEAQR